MTRSDPLSELVAPTAPRRPHTWHRVTGRAEDPWAWMADHEDPEFLAYLAAENDYADGWFEPHATTVEAVYDEIRARVQETDLSSPVEHHGWWYVTSTEEGRSYPVHHRGRSAELSTEHVLLDENDEAAGHEYFDLGAFDLSLDHTRVAWSVDTAGDERYTLRIRDLSTGTDLADRIDDVSNAGTAWSRDGSWLFYVRPDEHERPCEIWRHEVGTDPSDDVLVHREHDERFFVGIGTTRSEEWIVIHAESKTTSESRLLPIGRPTDTPSVVLPRRDDVEYTIDHWGGSLFVVLTNEEAIDFRVTSVELALDQSAIGGAPTTTVATSRELVPHEPGRRITGVDAFAGFLVVQEWADAQPRLRIVYRDGSERIVEHASEPHEIHLAATPQWDTRRIRFGIQSMTSPPSLWEEDVDTGERALIRRIPTPGVEPDDYVSTRTWATAPDGARVPIDLVHHRGTPLDGTAPGVLYGYGAYEASMPPWFSVARLSLLDRGWVWALAHPRGGGELGRRWYLDGRLLAKPNSFADFLACADHLVQTDAVAPERLAVRGGSAGGLLVGACSVQRPDRFAAVVAEVPFVDVVTTMSDPTLPLTVTEWEEWGDPRQEPFASLIESYSPYDNTGAADHPAMYVTAGLHDPRVSVHEPAKWVARLRATGTGDRAIVLRTEMGAGHGGPTGRYEAWRDEARVLAFLLATV